VATLLLMVVAVMVAMIVVAVRDLAGTRVPAAQQTCNAYMRGCV